MIKDVNVSLFSFTRYFFFVYDEDVILIFPPERDEEHDGFRLGRVLRGGGALNKASVSLESNQYSIDL